METVFYKGQRVTAVNSKYPGNGVIDKVNPRTIAVTLDGGHKVRYDRMFLVPEGTAPTAPEPITVEHVPYVAPPQPGTVVRVSSKLVWREPKLDGLWIVCGEQGGKSRLFRLNNTDGRYWRIPNEDLVRVHATVTEVGGA